MKLFALIVSLVLPLSPFELPIRAGIIEDIEEVRVSSDKDLVIDCGAKLIQQEGLCRFRIAESKPAELVYIPIVETIKATDKEMLGDTVLAWKEKGYPVIVREIGYEIPFKNGLTVDNRVYWVGLKEFKEKEKEEAERLIDSLYREGVKCWILEEVTTPPDGRIKVFDESGEVLHEAIPPIRISSASKIEVEGCLYEGKIEIDINLEGRLCLVNKIGIEEYLKGVVPREIEPSSPLEALKAQAVAARGETIAKLGKRHTSLPYDFCASQHCQVYAGLERQTPATNQAVAETEGEVLFYKDEIVDTVYCANCGGHTENNEDVWASQPDPSLRGIRDYQSDCPIKKIEEWFADPPPAYCSHQEGRFRWSKTYKAEEINEMVNKEKDVGRIKDIILGERGISKRLKDIEIIGTEGNFKIYKEYPIRKIFGGLRSAAFILEIKRDKDGEPIEFSFIGGGWGHGVGMCQAGAVGMARMGRSYKEILKHYYSNTEIKKLY